MARVSDDFTELEHNLQDPPMCFYCDEGGDLMFCDGPCSRHFHWNNTDPHKPDSCPSLDLTATEIEAMDTWECSDCKSGWAQCFLCPNLGKSDGSAAEFAEFTMEMCSALLCRRFYHKDCVEMELKGNCLLPANAELPVHFICPRHFCHGCHRPEGGPCDLVHCQRCSNAWCDTCYRKECKEWWFDNGIGMFENKMTRKDGSEMVWKYVYCYNHKIEKDLGTPAHDHY